MKLSHFFKYFKEMLSETNKNHVWIFITSMKKEFKKLIYKYSQN